MMQGPPKKFAFFESFWKGEGPFPLLFAKPHLAKRRTTFFTTWRNSIGIP